MVLKITGARNQPFSDIRKRALMQAGAKVVGRGPTRPDETAFLGLSEADLTPAVQGAIRTLLTEVDDLRQEVSRLKARLNQAEILADQDPLTPALNRRALMRELERIRTFSHRYGSPAALVYIAMRRGTRRSAQSPTVSAARCPGRTSWPGLAAMNSRSCSAR